MSPRARLLAALLALRGRPLPAARYDLLVVTPQDARKASAHAATLQPR